MKQPMRTLSSYVSGISITSIYFSLLYALLSSPFDQKLSFNLNYSPNLFGNIITNVILCWVFSLLWSLPALAIVKAFEANKINSRKVNLATAFIFSSAASLFHKYYAPESPPHQSIGSAFFNIGFAIFAFCVVTSALFGAYFYWAIYRHLGPGLE